jgi:hypothetical protein
MRLPAAVFTFLPRRHTGDADAQKIVPFGLVIKSVRKCKSPSDHRPQITQAIARTRAGRSFSP